MIPGARATRSDIELAWLATKKKEIVSLQTRIKNTSF